MNIVPYPVVVVVLAFYKKKSLNFTLTQVVSDRFCAIQIHLNNSESLIVIAVYLPCSNYSSDEYLSYFQDLQSAVSAYKSYDPVIITGDFNVNFANVNHHCDRKQLVMDFIDAHSLYIVSQSSVCGGLNYTFFFTSCCSMLDYIIANSSIANEILSCLIHPLHPLNLSDHLPISISLNVICELINSTENHLNRTQAVESDSITLYSEAVSLVTRPSIGIAGQSISELNNEIVYVSNVMKSAALNYLPLVKNKSKPRFDSPELKDLCDVSKSVWKRWNAGGRPILGPLYEVKKNANKRVHSCVANCYAILECQDIQQRDRMFRKGDRYHFKLICKQKSTCKKLFVGNETITDQTEIIKLLKSFGNTSLHLHLLVLILS